MKHTIDGKALIYADGAYNTPNGKTAHGLVRFTERYEVVGVIDQKYAGQDAGMVLDNLMYNIPIFVNLKSFFDKLSAVLRMEVSNASSYSGITLR